MTNPKYLVNIFYSSPIRTGSIGATAANGLWETTPLYSSGYFVATMPEIRISATGSTYTDALGALLSIATASTTYDAAQGPLIN